MQPAYDAKEAGEEQTTGILVVREPGFSTAGLRREHGMSSANLYL